MAWQLRLPGFATAAAWLCNRGDGIIKLAKAK
jgi:hypothetical protein